MSKKFLEIFRKLPATGLLIVIALFLFCGLIFVIIPLHQEAADIGNEQGTLRGNAVGLAIGSYDGVTKGIAAGKDEGLSAEDTAVKISNAIKSNGQKNLEVLIAGVKLTNFHSVGDKYAALYIYKGDAVFSIDLENVTVDTTQAESIYITIPSPTMTLYIDKSKTEKLAEERNVFFNGSTADGFSSYLNSMDKIIENGEEYIANYDELLESAQSSAKEQIEMLAKEICGEKYKYHIVVE